MARQLKWWGRSMAVAASVVSVVALSPAPRASAISGYGGLVLYPAANFVFPANVFWTDQYDGWVTYDLGNYAGMNNTISSAELGGADVQYACDVEFYENRDGSGGVIRLNNRFGVVKRDLYNENQVVNFANRTFSNGHPANNAISSISFKCYNIL